MTFAKKPYYSPKEVAAIAGVHEETVKRRVRDGRLEAAHLSARTIRIPLGAVLQWLAPGEVKPITFSGGPYKERRSRKVPAAVASGASQATRSR